MFIFARTEEEYQMWVKTQSNVACVHAEFKWEYLHSTLKFHHPPPSTGNWMTAELSTYPRGVREWNYRNYGNFNFIQAPHETWWTKTQESFTRSRTCEYYIHRYHSQFHLATWPVESVTSGIWEWMTWYCYWRSINMLRGHFFFLVNEWQPFILLTPHVVMRIPMRRRRIIEMLSPCRLFGSVVLTNLINTRI